ncbi:AI-2E family transporter [Streptomyces sp. NPDC051940]|uniref:AI-2E family transporter n=1 Tax=Streptomyces sp. NPDC051940 TaxID=3155675 RepID=UPI0034469055
MQEPRPLPAVVRSAAAWSAALLLIGALAAALVLLFVWLRAGLVPVLLALLVVALLEPVDRWLRRMGVPRGAAAGLTCVALVVGVGGALWLLVTVLAETAGDITDYLAQAADSVTGEGPLARMVKGAADGLSDLGSALATTAAKGVLSGLGMAAQVLAGAVLTLALAFFILRDRVRAVAALRALSPARHRDLVVAMARRAYRAMAGFMRGTTIIALIDATFIAIGLALLGVPHAGSLGALVFFGAYVPYVGAFLTGAVAVLVALGDGGIGEAFAALGVVLAVQLLEGSVLQPMIQSRTVSMHPALVMVAVTAGAAVGGLLGALLAVPLAAGAFGMVAELRDRRAV